MLSMYQRIIRPLLFTVDPERIHRMIVPLSELVGATALGRSAIGVAYRYPKNDAEVTVDSLTYHTPIVLSAGFDPNGRLVRTLSSCGFGGEEVGSVTARPCAGNAPPRQVRLPHTKSLIVNKGLANWGVERVTTHLKRLPKEHGFVVGVSIARTNDTEACELESGIEDYATSLAHLTNAGVGDYYTINISCPNTWTGELFLDAKNLTSLLTRLSSVGTTKPVYIKMPISVAHDTFLALAEAAAAFPFIRGLIIGNLWKNYDAISPLDTRPMKYQGGLSGMPCQTPSNELISLAKQHYGDRFTLIGCGGVFTAKDALEKFERGASLIHLITGMIYTGPGLMKDIARSYASWRSSR